jgi:type IV pilus assembly protein PilQ
MGDVVMSRLSAGRRRIAWATAAAAAILPIALAAGCASSTKATPARVVEARPASEQAPAVQAKAASPPTEIRSLDLREGAPEVYVDLHASAPLVWTSYRNAEGRVVVELPNAVPGARIQDLAPEEGLVASVKVQRESEGSRPLTRLVIATRREAEHSVTADGMSLQIRLLPLDETAKAAGSRPAPEAVKPSGSRESAKQKLAFEPIGAAPPASPSPSAAESSSPPAAAASASAPSTAAAPSSGASGAIGASGASGAMRAGTPDAPAVAPAPSGPAASRLDGVEVLAADGGATAVRLSGDGEFPYSTFALADPSRFVIDLPGVINRSQRGTVPVTGGVVQRVRVAQFRQAPRPVARVVFDLQQGVVPRIERTSRGLVVTFGSAGPGPGASEKTAPAPPPPAAPPSAGAQGAPAVAVSAAAAPSRQEASPSPSSPAPAPSRPAAPRPKRAKKLAEPAVAPAATEQGGAAAPAAAKGAKRAPGIEVEDAPAATASRMAAKSESSGLPRVAPGSSLQPSSDLGLKQAAPAAAGGKPKSANEIFSAQSVGVPDEKVYTGEPIDLKVTNADITEVLRSFAQISGLNIVVQPGVTGTVTAELENVPWDQAFEEVLKINNLGYEREGNVIRIAPTAVLRQEAQDRQQLAQARALAIPLRTVMRRLSYAQAPALAALLRSGAAGLLSQRGSVIVDERTNTLIIKELPTFLDSVMSVVDLLDTPEPQVMIEARIIETTKRFTRNLGINWGFNAIADAAHGNTTGLIFPNNITASGRVPLDSAGNNGSINLRLGNVLNTFSLDVALQAAESEGLINILSAPKVATLNNQIASVQSGVQIPIQTVANGTVTVQFINATLRLEVTPQVTAEGTVMMDINISKREPQTSFLLPGAQNVPIATKDARTRLVVRDGGTAVIGGIYKVTTNFNENRVPGLANIPIVGHLFKNRARSDDNDELLIFITPRVIKI